VLETRSGRVKYLLRFKVVNYKPRQPPHVFDSFSLGEFRNSSLQAQQKVQMPQQVMVGGDSQQRLIDGDSY
jgi:hypothetical protein